MDANATSFFIGMFIGIIITGVSMIVGIYIYDNFKR